MKFQKIVAVDPIRLEDWAIEELQDWSKEPVAVHAELPESEEVVVERIGQADAILVSWHTEISEAVIARAPNLRYIGMACTLYNEEAANVAIGYARKKGITVRAIRDYGDPGVAEFVVSQLIQLLHGYGEYRWKEMPLELTERKIGIIGFGTTGKLLASCIQPFKADLFYYSRTRYEEWEGKGVKFLPLKELLETCEIISFHLPRGVNLLGEKEFRWLGKGKILINTSLGLPFEENPFKDWIKHTGNFAIFDGDGKKALSVETEKLFNVITFEKGAGWSGQTQRRLSEKVLDNIKNYLSK